jgi:hypothetical protein
MNKIFLLLLLINSASLFAMRPLEERPLEEAKRKSIFLNWIKNESKNNIIVKDEKGDFAWHIKPGERRTIKQWVPITILNPKDNRFYERNLIIYNPQKQGEQLKLKLETSVVLPNPGFSFDWISNGQEENIGVRAVRRGQGDESFDLSITIAENFKESNIDFTRITK